MQNLTTADIARQLKLSVWQVEALEAGRYQQLPGPIFVRGFIRNYARLVKLDAGELLRDAGDSLPQTSVRQDTPPSRDIPFPTEQSPRWPRYAGAAVAIFAALAAYEFLWNEPEPISTPAAAVTQPAVAAKPRIERAVAAAPVQAQPATPPAPAVIALADPVEKPAAPVSEAPKPRAAGERQVKMVFNQECWVEIRDRRDRVVFSQLNRPGTVQEFTAAPPLAVVIGNAHGVQMTYDDQPVDLARHTKIDVARFTLE